MRWKPSLMRKCEIQGFVVQVVSPQASGVSIKGQEWKMWLLISAWGPLSKAHRHRPISLTFLAWTFYSADVSSLHTTYIHCLRLEWSWYWCSRTPATEQSSRRPWTWSRVSTSISTVIKSSLYFLAHSFFLCCPQVILEAFTWFPWWLWRYPWFPWLGTGRETRKAFLWEGDCRGVLLQYLLSLPSSLLKMTFGYTWRILSISDTTVFSLLEKLNQNYMAKMKL